MFSETNILNQTEHKRISSRFFGLFNRKGCILTIVSLLTTKKERCYSKESTPANSHSSPSVLGIKPIPNILEKIQKMIAKYHAETIDIEDVEYKEADLGEGVLFNSEGERNN